MNSRALAGIVFFTLLQWQSEAAVAWFGEIESEPRPPYLDEVTFDWLKITVLQAGDYQFTMSPIEQQPIPYGLRFNILTEEESVLTWVYESSQMRWRTWTETLPLQAGNYLVQLTTEYNDWDTWNGMLPSMVVKAEGSGPYQFSIAGEQVRATLALEGNLDGTYTRTVIPEPEYPAASWLLAHGIRYDTDLHLDLNGDGVTLLTSYALDLDPSNPHAGMPVPVLDPATMSMTSYGAAQGVTYGAETSTDCQNWVTEGVMVSDADPANMRTVTVNRDATMRFVRLTFGSSP